MNNEQFFGRKTEKNMHWYAVWIQVHGLQAFCHEGACEEDFVRLTYVLEKDGFIDSVDADIPENSIIPSVTGIFS